MRRVLEVVFGGGVGAALCQGLHSALSWAAVLWPLADGQWFCNHPLAF